jgi:hypothetical protein
VHADVGPLVRRPRSGPRVLHMWQRQRPRRRPEPVAHQTRTQQPLPFTDRRSNWITLTGMQRATRRRQKTQR